MTDDDRPIPGGVLRWEDPPRYTPAQGRRAESNWRLIAVQLRDRPGEWALAAKGKHASGQHHRIVGGKIGHWAPAGSFEATVRRIDDVPHLWIRYVGLPPDVEQDG
jgi:hypothetical protein